MQLSNVSIPVLAPSLMIAVSVLAGCEGSRAATGAEGSTAEAVIGSLTITTIGSTVDPINGDQNPYGLAIAPVSAGMLAAGDLVI